MTDDELLAKAGAEVPEEARRQGKIVRRASTVVNPNELAGVPDEDPDLLAGLEKLLKIKLPPAPASSACADVAYEYQREDGQSAITVVQIRGGEVVRKFRRG